MSLNKDMIRIGGFSAFWGDSPTAAAQLVRRGGHLDYLIGDYLAEVTLCLLARIKNKKSSKLKKSQGEGGFVKEFVTTVWKPLMSEIIERKIKVITNAGGMNPMALKLAIEKAAFDAGVECPPVAVVLGDDITARVNSHDLALEPFSLLGETETQWKSTDKLMSSNAYLGAKPIAQALAHGAQIVITGRCVDSALVLGPLLHEFGWKMGDYDLLSAGSLAGHIIECGCQCTGGNFTDWKLVQRGYHDMGFPIAECFKDGSVVITKPENTGGIVSVGSVSEQIVYEIGDSAAYMLPDVICDWTQVTVKQLTDRNNAVRVTGARGLPPTPFYKVGSTAQRGFTMEGSLLVSGFDAVEKAESVAQAIIRKCGRLFKLFGLGKFLATRVELLGAETTYGEQARPEARDTRELVLRIVVHHMQPKALALFAKELAPTATSMVPGLAGAGGGRPKLAPFIVYYSSLVAKSKVPVSVQVGSNASFPVTSTIASDGKRIDSVAMHVAHVQGKAHYQDEIFVKVPLIALCYARSGDKGDSCNIGLIAREALFYPFIREIVTTQAVAKYFSHFVEGSVARYELPGIHALNFVCTKALGGGGIGSLNVDRQGKSYGQKLLAMRVHVPASFVKASPYRRARM